MGQEGEGRCRKMGMDECWLAGWLAGCRSSVKGPWVWHFQLGGFSRGDGKAKTAPLGMTWTIRDT